VPQASTTLPDGAIHALRTPIAALQSAIDVFALPVGASLQAEAQAVARRQVRRLAELVAELDGFHRLQQMAQGRPGCEPVALRLAPMLAQAREQVAAESDGIDGVDGILPALPALPPRLQVRCLPEILHPGLVALWRHAAQHALRLRADAGDGRMRLHTGEPAGNRGPVEPPAADGLLGGGLELLRRLAQASGGGLRLDPSDPGGGFCLELPLAPDGPGAPGAAGAARSAGRAD
jgi:signal transduction histidine kinase